ncbi:MAG: TetR/AcrR family transcriptional regulator [Verrucomicrobiota bacterium JB022]|nr:TetR/AcrR family transcriptional regulator [Verrucomicrobiota bacterium JB022]
MDTHDKIVSAAEQLFYRHGFVATGVDRLTQAAGMSSRTLYKHAGSKTALITAVLAERDRRFLSAVKINSVSALFQALEDWVRVEGSRGCLFLRAYGETGGDIPEIAAAVTAHKAHLHEKIQEILAVELGGADNSELADQILILFEGATAAAVYRGVAAVKTGCRMAEALVEQARS